jgi:hypothetical protein
MSNRAHVPTEIAKPGSSINDMETPRIRKRDLKAGGVATELLEASFTDWSGAADAVEF